ncbi:MAG: hypothetical protein HFJ25_02335 [Clostridia bacterium]|jgi:hypothetical protein|nr:hypothetical protein [Clostridia bacterium]
MNVEKKSLFSKLIDKLKNTALYDILFNESAGMVINSENTDTIMQVESLAQVSGMSAAEVMSIEAEFNKANSRMEPLETIVQRVPQEKDNSKNPFAVNEKDLNHDVPKSQPKTKKEISKEHDSI